LADLLAIRDPDETAGPQGSLRLPDGTLLATASASAVLLPFPK
jgi:hypothetical protein